MCNVETIGAFLIMQIHIEVIGNNRLEGRGFTM